ncbi:hypothetical protein Ancab_023933 [Ancistrocladus abbreviatus]
MLNSIRDGAVTLDSPNYLCLGLLVATLSASKAADLSLITQLSFDRRFKERFSEKGQKGKMYFGIADSGSSGMHMLILNLELLASIQDGLNVVRNAGEDQPKQSGRSPRGRSSRLFRGSLSTNAVRGFYFFPLVLASSVQWPSRIPIFALGHQDILEELRKTGETLRKLRSLKTEN